MTSTALPTRAGRATVCPPSPVTLTPSAVQLGPLAGWDTTVSGVAVDDRHVYATHAHVGKVNRHESPGPGELVVYDRAALAAGAPIASLTPLRVPTGWQPRNVASLVRPEYRRVFVVNYHQESYSVSVYDRDDFSLVRETEIGMVPIDVVTHARRGRAYVSKGYSGIQVLDARTGALLPGEAIALDREVIGLAVDEDTDELFVARTRHYGDGAPVDDLVVIDLVTRQVTHTLPLPPSSGPYDVAVDAGLVHVATFGTVGGQAGVHVFDRARLTAPPRLLPTTAGAHAVAVHGGHVYAAAGGGVNVLDVARGARVGSVALGPDVRSVAVDPFTGDVYAGDERDGELHRIAPLVTGSPIGRHPAVASGSLGAPLGAARPTPGGDGVVQQFQLGSAVATADHGAVAIAPGHAATWLRDTDTAVPVDTLADEAVRAVDPAIHDRLGNPIGDTRTVAGRQVSFFDNGMVATVPIGGVLTDVAVSGPIWARHTEAGGINGSYGEPVAHEVLTARGNRSQRFENVTILHANGAAAAHAVWHGSLDTAWRERFGGPGGVLGHPVADMVRGFNEHTGAALEWLELTDGAIVADIGADTVTFLDGVFWRAWQREGGPTGPLGLPLGNPAADPSGLSPARHVDFERGVLAWFPKGHRLAVDDGDGCHAVTSLELFVKQFRVRHNDQESPDNAADLYVNHYLGARHGDGEAFFRWDGRLGEPWEEVTQVQVDLPVAITDVVRGDLFVDLDLIGRDDDEFPDLDGDDTLGEFHLRYGLHNLWGIGENDEFYSESDKGEFWAYLVMKAIDVETSIGADFRDRFFWKFDNFDTARMSPATYGRTFHDVVPGLQFHIDPLEYLHEAWESAFYHLAYKGVGKSGNCFGMCAEAIAAYHHRSVFSQPINAHGHRQDDWPADHDLYGDPTPGIDDELIENINVRHGYQLGSKAVMWFADHILDGVLAGDDASISDGRRVWIESRMAMLRGDWPVLCMVREWKTSGHVVLPIEWHQPGGPDGDWEIWLADPSEPRLAGETEPGPDDPPVSAQHKITIKPDGSWHYKGSYNSAEPRWLFWVPYSIFATQPRTPGKEAGAILAAVGLSTKTLFGLGGEADTRQISDASGRTLYRQGLAQAPRTPLDLRRRADKIPGAGRVPLFGAVDGPVDNELHVAAGRHATLAHDIVPRAAGGEYRWTMRSGAMAAVLSAPTDTSPDRVAAEDVGTGRRAVSVSRPRNAPEKAVSLLVEGMPHDNATGKRLVRQFHLDDLTIAGGRRIVARVADGGSDLLVSAHDGQATCVLRLRGEVDAPLSRPRSITVPAGRTLRLRPADWSRGGLDSAPVRVEVRDTPDGPPTQCYELLPDGPAES